MAPQCALLDDVASDLIEHLMSRGRRILVVNEYGIMPVTRSCAPNIALRAAGLLAMRDERSRLHLDAGESRALAVTDHQIAHVYVADHQDIDAVVSCLQTLDGVDQVLRGDDLVVHGLSHERCGDCVLVAKADSWFRHDWWTCPQEAPDYQRTVDIHRKPGYDPRELFIDPAIRVPKLALALRLLRKKLGFRTLMDVIPLDPTLVRGSHGRCDAADEPIVWSSEPNGFSRPHRHARCVGHHRRAERRLKQGRRTVMLDTFYRQSNSKMAMSVLSTWPSLLKSPSRIAIWRSDTGRHSVPSPP